MCCPCFRACRRPLRGINRLATDSAKPNIIARGEQRAMSKKRGPDGRPPPSGRPKNLLLAALPAKDFRRLRPYLTTVPIRWKQVLHRPANRSALSIS